MAAAVRKTSRVSEAATAVKQEKQHTRPYETPNTRISEAVTPTKQAKQHMQTYETPNLGGRPANSFAGKSSVKRRCDQAAIQQKREQAMRRKRERQVQSSS